MFLSENIFVEVASLCHVPRGVKSTDQTYSVMFLKAHVSVCFKKKPVFQKEDFFMCDNFPLYSVKKSNKYLKKMGSRNIGLLK